MKSLSKYQYHFLKVGNNNEIHMKQPKPLKYPQILDTTNKTQGMAIYKGNSS